MSRGINKVTLLGNLGEDPEVKTLAGGKVVCNMSLATNESYKDASGQVVQRTEWHRLTAWDRLAEICGEYLKKGSQVYFEGKLKTEKYQKDGVDMYTTKIIIKEMMMLSGGGTQQSQGASKPASQSVPSQFEPDDDLPF